MLVRPPRPTPTISRPPLSWSRLPRLLASWTGLRSGGRSTATPSRTRRGRGATQAGGGAEELPRGPDALVAERLGPAEERLEAGEIHPGLGERLGDGDAELHRARRRHGLPPPRPRG